MARSKTLLVTVDLEDVLIAFSPHRPRMASHANRALTQFMERFTVHDIIENSFLIPQERLDNNDDLIWKVIEYRFPQGTGDFEDDQDAIATFDFIVSLIIQTTDEILRRKAQEHGFEDDYPSLAFEAWLNKYTALFRSDV